MEKATATLKKAVALRHADISGMDFLDTLH